MSPFRAPRSFVALLGEGGSLCCSCPSDLSHLRSRMLATSAASPNPPRVMYGAKDWTSHSAIHITPSIPITPRKHAGPNWAAVRNREATTSSDNFCISYLLRIFPYMFKLTNNPAMPPGHEGKPIARRHNHVYIVGAGVLRKKLGYQPNSRGYPISHRYIGRVGGLAEQICYRKSRSRSAARWSAMDSSIKLRLFPEHPATCSDAGERQHGVRSVEPAMWHGYTKQRAM
jgi:hypothetical protein